MLVCSYIMFTWLFKAWTNVHNYTLPLLDSLENNAQQFFV